MFSLVLVSVQQKNGSPEGEPSNITSKVCTLNITAEDQQQRGPYRLRWWCTWQSS